MAQKQACQQVDETGFRRLGEVCRHRHDPAPDTQKRPTRSNFARGLCRFGDACRFSHETPSSGGNTTARSTSQAQDVGSFLRGHRQIALRCPTRQQDNCKQGTCRFGTARRFSHDAVPSLGGNTTARPSSQAQNTYTASYNAFVRLRYDIPRGNRLLAPPGRSAAVFRLSSSNPDAWSTQA